MKPAISTTIKILMNSIEGFFDVLQKGADALIPRNDEYRADFGSASSLLSPWNKGFNLTGRSSLTIKNSHTGALIVGGTGTGKSTTVLIPTILTAYLCSLIIHDPSGELYAKTAGYLLSKGYNTKRLHFSRAEISCGYNPLSRIQSASDIQKLCSMLVTAALGSGNDPFWKLMAINLLSLIIGILKKQPEEFYNLYNARHLLNQLGSDPTKVNFLFAKYADPVAYAEFKSFLAYEPKLRSSIIASCKAALVHFSDETVARITSFDTLDFEEFRQKPTAIFIQNNVSEAAHFSTLVSVFFEQFFGYMLDHLPQKEERDVMFLIDEASSLNIPILPLASANIRKHRGAILLCIQDFAQLQHLYGKDAQSIKANLRHRLYFTGQSLETAKELEAILGKYQFKDDKERTSVRPLLTADEIIQMDSTTALLLAGHHAPFKVRLKPYYQRYDLRERSNIPAPENMTEIPYVPLSLLSINVPQDETA